MGVNKRAQIETMTPETAKLGKTQGETVFVSIQCDTSAMGKTVRGTIVTLLQRYWWISPSVILNCHLAMQGAWPWAFFGTLISSVIFAAFMGVRLENALAARRFGLMFAFAPLFLIAVIFNFIMALGSVSISRDSFAGKRAIQIQSQDILRDRNASLGKALASLRSVTNGQVAGVIQAELAQLQASNIYARTKGCAPTEVTLSESEVYCGKVAKVMAKLAAAKKSDDLMKEQKRIWADLTAVEDAPSAADPQASTLAILIGAGTNIDKNTEKITKAGISGLFALIAEIMAAFGPMVSSFKFDKEKRQEDPKLANNLAMGKPQRRKRRNKSHNSEASLADVKIWFQSRIEARSGAEIASGTLYQDFKTWCYATNLAPLNITRFGNFLTNDLKLRKIRNSHVKYLDVALKPALRVVSS